MCCPERKEKYDRGDAGRRLGAAPTAATTTGAAYTRWRRVRRGALRTAVVARSWKRVVGEVARSVVDAHLRKVYLRFGNRLNALSCEFPFVLVLQAPPVHTLSCGGSFCEYRGRYTNQKRIVDCTPRKNYR